jgi:hypothetical protein
MRSHRQISPQPDGNGFSHRRTQIATISRSLRKMHGDCAAVPELMPRYRTVVKRPARALGRGQYV